MFGPLFDLSFWFTLQPDTLTPTFERFFFFFFAVMIVLGAGARIVARHKKGDLFGKTTYRKVAAMLMSMGVIGLVWFFFTFEGAYLLGARFWFLLWVIGFIAWAVVIYRYRKISVPTQQAAMESRADENKYLPRKKNRK